MTSIRQKRYMQMAIDLAEQALDEKKGGPFGALIVRDDKIVGASGNCEFKNMDPCAHAEIMAIRDACQNLQTLDLSDCEMYSSGEPCPMCTAAIYWAKMKCIYFSNSEEQALEYGFLDKIILSELRKPKQKRKIKNHKISNRFALELFKKAAKAGIV
jgi:guanine deaminase